VLYIVIAHFRRGFGRSRDCSATVPTGQPSENAAGLSFIGSWVDVSLRRCFQVIDCSEPAALQRWVAQWRHCVDFDVVPVVPGAEAVIALQPLLD